MEEQIIRKKRLNYKKVTCFTGFFVALFLICGGLTAVFWAGGWMKEMTCGAVFENSYLSEKFDCDNENISTTITSQGETIDINIPDDISSQEDLIKVIIEQASPAVVTIATDNVQFDPNEGIINEQAGIGSGFVVDSSGIIVTNQHVVSDENSTYSVILPNDENPIKVANIYRDRTNDIAIIKIDRNDLKALKLGDSDKLVRGSTVIAIGNPFGDLEGTVTSGIVSGLGRDVTAGSGFFGSTTMYEDVIQTDAAINPGNSGGPLLNSNGEVVGINFATTSGADNISFAIPVNRLKVRLEVFKKDGRFPQPYIGISFQQRSFFYQTQVITGAIVYQVESNGPADKAGLKAGDAILEADGKSMETYSLLTVIQETNVGEQLELKVWRDGEEMTISVVVGDKGD